MNAPDTFATVRQLSVRDALTHHTTFPSGFTHCTTTYGPPMSYTIVDVGDLDPGAGPHPAASSFDKRISEHLGLTAFEIYQVELPPGEQTVLHDHTDDGVEDTYAVVRGDGWLVVDDEQVPIRPSQFAAVDLGSRRQVRAGASGLVFIAVCAPAR